jgi:hypothetical protein
MKITLKTISAGLFIITGMLAGVCFGTHKVSALSGADFQPGYIISDSLFFNPNAMGANDIQTFLSSKVPVCDTNGSQPSSHFNSSAGRYYTRGEWGALNGNPPPYTCLKNYTQNVPGAAADTYCGNGVSAGNKSAAMIISEVSWACGINPQVMIVLLQKEQGLVTDDWPWPSEYQIATGYGCPDTAACDSQYYGFFNQVYNAAHQFQRYVKQSQVFNFRGGQTSVVPYNPNSSCGGASVYMQTNATAALYNYTPYQPNAAALANLNGSGDACSAYGNRNFWVYFNNWFGSPTGDLVQAPGDHTVYLLSGSTAYTIRSVNVMNDFAALGPVRIVPAGVINTYTSGGTLTNMVGDPGGTLYLVNANIKLPFSSCDMIADYGYSCGQVSDLTTLQLNKLVNGPPVTSTMRSVSNGTVYYVSGGSKRIIPGINDYLAFRIRPNFFTDSLVDQVPTSRFIAYGPGSLVKTPNSNTVYMVKDINNLMTVPNFIYPLEYGLSLNVRTIASNYTVLGAVENKIQCGGSDFITTNGGTYYVSPSMMTNYGFSSNEFIDVGGVCNTLYYTPQPLSEFIRIVNGTIYDVTGGQKHPIAGLGIYQAHGGNSGNTIQVSDFFASTIPTGSTITQ